MANRMGETMETMTDFIFLGFKVTADSNCSHEIKRRLLLGGKKYDKPRQIIKKQRHHFAIWTKVHIVKTMVFPVVIMYERIEPQRMLSAKELMLLNYGAG